MFGFIIKAMAIVTVCIAIINMIVDISIRFSWIETKGKYIGYQKADYSQQIKNIMEDEISTNNDESLLLEKVGNIFEYIVNDKQYTGYTLTDLRKQRLHSINKTTKIIVNPDDMEECLICSKLYTRYIKENIILFLALLVYFFA